MLLYWLAYGHGQVRHRFFLQKNEIIFFFYYVIIIKLLNLIINVY